MPLSPGSLEEQSRWPSPSVVPLDQLSQLTGQREQSERAIKRGQTAELSHDLGSVSRWAYLHRSCIRTTDSDGRQPNGSDLPEWRLAFQPAC